ncbi:PilX N-terminal domain-containing pilus assembly protein [Thioalkalivibrio sp. ALRh]|uniref:pilus assembly PilX family protein n=1 Tax=Thioalkalivibrio sp. ALRh TaxID=1266911 RepID=UPI00037BAAF1
MASRRQQRGVATLVIALVIMVAVTITVIFTAQTSILEQRMAANEIRMKQTASAAQGGLERAMSHMQGSNIPMRLQPEDADDRTWRAVFLAPEASTDTVFNHIDRVCPPTPENFPTSEVANRELTWNANDPSDPNNDNLREATILSCGWSDDFSSRKAVMLGMQAGPAVANPPDNPLLTRGGVDIRGNAEVYNAYTNMTIRTGDAAGINSNTGATFMRNPAQQPPRLEDPVPRPGDDIYRMMSTKDDQGLDVVDFDPSLRIDPDVFFRSFMGMSKTQYRERMANHELVGSTQGGGPEITPDQWGQVIWVEGDTRLEDNVGSRDNPVILVVNGDLTVRGNFDEFHGILYVTGDLDATGNPEFYGAAIIEGDAIIDDPTTSIAGTPRFIFDPVAAGGGANVGARGVTSGSWRDWTSF